MPTARVTNSFFDIQITMKQRGPVPIVIMVRRLLDLLPTLIQQLIKECQKHWLEDDLGPYGTVGQLFDRDRLRCPRCGHANANRKEWSNRTWTVPVLGELEVPLRWVECKQCGRSWTPYKETLGIEDHVQYSSEVMIEHLEEAVKTTYQTASQMNEDSPSAMTIWRRMLALEPTFQSDEDIDQTVCLDATKIPKHKETGQWVLTVAQALDATLDGPWNRTCLAGTLGQEVAIKEPLRQFDIQRLMHDGQLNVDELCETEGRCGWHVPHTVRLLLHQDEIHGEENKRRWYWLHSIVWDDESSDDEWTRRIEDWIEANKDSAPIATSHVQHAKEGLRSVRHNENDFGMKTNSLIEREMVEINKRFENGGGWTKRGGTAMLKHHQLWRHDTDEWKRQMKNNDGLAIPDNQQNSQT